jgi:hypothetical protein
MLTFLQLVIRIFFTMYEYNKSIIFQQQSLIVTSCSVLLYFKTFQI